MKPENMHHVVGSCLPNAFTNGGSSMHTGMHNAVEMSAHAGRLDAPQNMLSTQNSNMGLMQGINGGIIKSEVGGMIKSEVGRMIKPEVGGVIKSEVGYSSSSPYLFGADNNVLEGRPNIGDASVSHFSTVDSNSQALNDSLLDMDTSSFGFLGQIPRNFSLSDLTADFSQSSGTSRLFLFVYLSLMLLHLAWREVSAYASLSLEYFFGPSCAIQLHSYR